MYTLNQLTAYRKLQAVCSCKARSEFSFKSPILSDKERLSKTCTLAILLVFTVLLDFTYRKTDISIPSTKTKHHNVMFRARPIYGKLLGVAPLPNLGSSTPIFGRGSHMASSIG